MTPETPMTPTELWAIRKSHGLSAADLAHFLDIGERTLRRWEAGGGTIPAGVADQVRGIEDTINDLAEHIRADCATALAHGLWSVELPPDASFLPDWVRPDIPLALWQAGAARAHEVHGVRLTSVRDAP